VRVGLQRLYWNALGGRKLRAFGNVNIFDARTALPNRIKYPLPRKGSRADINTYADYVQMRAMCNYVASLEEPPVIVEVGAFHGIHTVMLGNIARKLGGRLIAIEPNPVSFEVMSSNVGLNKLDGVVQRENVAVMDGPGEAEISLSQSASSLAAAAGDTARKVKVKTVSLGHILQKHSVTKIDLLKIDIEGAELFAFKGLPWDSVEIGMISCELHPFAWGDFGYTAAEFFSFLEAKGYRAVDMYLREVGLREVERNPYSGPTIFFRFQGAFPPSAR
jgi:FkbM family methyltransferase